jgi:hypothetical protein
MRSYRTNNYFYIIVLYTVCGAIIALVNTSRPPYVAAMNDTSRMERQRNEQLLLQQQSQYRTLTTNIPSVGQITRLRLVNATINNAGQPLIDPLVNGTIINLQDYPVGQQFSIEALVSNKTGPIGSIRFVNVDGKGVTENNLKYSLCGDKKGSFSNCSAISKVGTKYTVKATPYSHINASGMAGIARTVQFSVVNNTPPGWVIVDPAAPIWKRHESCFVLVGRNGYLIAGRARRNVEIYNTIHRTWSLGAEPPIQIHHAQCVVADEKIWIVSSWTGGYPMETNTKYIYVRITSYNNPIQ